MTPEEKVRRKAILRAVRYEEKERAEAALPAPITVLRGLFDWLDEKLIDGCDESLRFTREYAQRNGLNEELLVNWTQEYGGYCDCEVLANVEDSNPALSR